MNRALLFGLPLRAILIGALVVGVFFTGTLWALNTFFPADPMSESKPELVALHPMAPVTRTSVIVAPVAVAALAIRDIMEVNAPRALNGELAGTRLAVNYSDGMKSILDTPVLDLTGVAEIGRAHV